ncbi:MAG: tyrosine-type recombinase/integrase [Kiritimatiellae bacterium]|nr:tyrosine-type recombinase/integrase [Kiritimatiellia bacterium]
MASLKLMKDRPTWHGNVKKEDGTRTVVNLGVPVRGKRPDSGQVGGDQAFKNSRIRAEEALKRLVASMGDPHAVISAQKTIVRLKGGDTEKEVRLSELPELARDLSDGAEAQKSAVEGRARQFADFVRELMGKDVPLSRVGVKEVQAFYDSLRDSKSTFRRREGELRRLFREYTPLGVRTPFEAKKKKDRLRRPEHIQSDTVQHRTPFTPEELKRIFAVAKAKDSRIYPLIVLAAGTGLRKGDLCTLEWASVDLKAGMLRVVPRKTSKYGKEVIIPLSPSVQGVLKNVNSVGKYVFPKIAEIYLSGRGGSETLRRELKVILAEALGDGDGGQSSEGRGQVSGHEGKDLEKVGDADAYMKCVACIAGLGTTERRRERLKEVARLYLLEGLTYKQIKEKAGYAKSQISEALRDLEDETGLKLRRYSAEGKRSKIREVTTCKPSGRRYRQSVRDWHSFRTTWITEALKSGWSVADVQKVTGHAETQIVLENYFRPGEDHLKQLPVPASAAV